MSPCACTQCFLVSVSTAGSVGPGKMLPFGCASMCAQGLVQVSLPSRAFHAVGLLVVSLSPPVACEASTSAFAGVCVQSALARLPFPNLFFINSKYAEETDLVLTIRADYEKPRFGNISLIVNMVESKKTQLFQNKKP